MNKDETIKYMGQYGFELYAASKNDSVLIFTQKPVEVLHGIDVHNINVNVNRSQIKPNEYDSFEISCPCGKYAITLQMNKMSFPHPFWDEMFVTLKKYSSLIRSNK